MLRATWQRESGWPWRSAPDAEMGTIQIGRTLLECKDYECSQDEIYVPREQLSLWLYINLTDACPASCPFCVHTVPGEKGGHADPDQLSKVLSKTAPFISGVSLTGGEPMTDIPLMEEVIAVIREQIPADIELDMVTNGLHIEKLPGLRGLERVTTVHISRHAAEDEQNAALMRWAGAPSKQTLKQVFSALPDPGMTVLNCVLQKNGVHDAASVREYLETAAWIGAANVSLIGMFLANDYCTEQYVSPVSIPFTEDPRFRVWNHYHDHDYCQCSTGSYNARSGPVRYYFRCPGNVQGPALCRQLVYGSDNRLRAGFGDAAVIDISDD